MTGECHCGAVSVTVPQRPEYVNFCDCSLCAKTGGVWGYYEERDLIVTGETHTYRRADYKEPAVEMHSCANCGTATHWITTEHFKGDPAGVNVRIFEPAEVDGVEARFPDGRNWFGKTTPRDRRPPGKLGVDAFL